MTDNDIWMQSINNMMNHINADNNLREYVINGPDDNEGFMWDDNEYIKRLSTLVDSDGHSGCSFAICLRSCQALLKKQQSMHCDNADADASCDADANASCDADDSKSKMP